MFSCFKHHIVCIIAGIYLHYIWYWSLGVVWVWRRDKEKNTDGHWPSAIIERTHTAWIPLLCMLPCSQARPLYLWGSLWAGAAIPFGLWVPCAPTWCWWSDRFHTRSWSPGGSPLALSFTLKMDFVFSYTFQHYTLFSTKKNTGNLRFHRCQFSLGRVNILPTLRIWFMSIGCTSVYLGLHWFLRKVLLLSLEILNNFCLIFS